MERIYITGIAGLLGSNIVRELKDIYEITGVDCNEIDVYGVDYDKFDLLNEKVLRESIEKRGPDIIIHTAAIVNVDLCEENKELAYEMNAKVTQNIADISREKGIKLVYISTDAVFDGEDDKLYTENDFVNPINEYGKTKYQGEDYVRQLDNGLVLRTNIYGINIQKKESFGEWIISSLLRGEELKMFTDIFFSPILVNDLAHIIDKCLKKRVSGTYHVCATGAISKYDFGIFLKDEFHINTGKIEQAESRIMHFKAPRSKNMGMSNEKICNLLGVKLRTPKESICEFKRLYIQKNV